MARGNSAKRARHLREQRERKARRREAILDAASQGRGTCSACGFEVVATMPIIGGIGQAATLGGPLTPITGGDWTATAPCPRCGNAVSIANLTTAPMSNGFESVFFASTEADRNKVIHLLEALRSRESGFDSPDELADFIDDVAPTLHALADWVRRHQDALIAALIPSIFTLLVAVLQGQQQGITPEQLDQILEEHSTPQVVIVDEDAHEPGRRPRKQDDTKREIGGGPGAKQHDHSSRDEENAPHE